MFKTAMMSLLLCGASVAALSQTPATAKKDPAGQGAANPPPANTLPPTGGGNNGGNNGGGATNNNNAGAPGNNGGNNNSGTQNSGGGSGASDTGPKDLTIDLAEGPGSNARAPGTYRLHLINRVPKTPYATSTKVISNKVAPPFDVGILSAKPPTPSPGAAGPSACDTQWEALKTRLAGAKCELEVASIRLSYGLSLSQCSADEVKKYTNEIDKATEWRDTDALEPLEAGDALDVTVARNVLPGDKDVSCQPISIAKAGNSSVSGDTRTLGTWHYEFGKREAQWLTFYGFNFAPGHDENFFAKTNAGTNPTTYTITRSHDRTGKSFSPSVYVFRLPAEEGPAWSRWMGWRSGDTMGGLTAGLGFDLDNPTVFLGYGIGWGYNLMLNAGVVMHKEKRLKGQYNENDVVSENLTSDQLLDSTYKPRAYIGLAFRFGSNPFKSSGGAGSGSGGKSGDSGGKAGSSSSGDKKNGGS